MLLALALACAGKDATDSEPVDTAVAIEIVSPADGETVPTCFPVTVEIRNFTLTDYLQHTDPVDGQGHWHLDFGDRYFVCEDLDCDLDLSGSPEGDVTLRAVLVGNDHNGVLDEDGAPIDDTVVVEHVADPCHEE